MNIKQKRFFPEDSLIFENLFFSYLWFSVLVMAIIQFSFVPRILLLPLNLRCLLDVLQKLVIL